MYECLFPKQNFSNAICYGAASFGPAALMRTCSALYRTSAEVHLTVTVKKSKAIPVTGLVGL
jgi:hypothetical protein